MEESQRTTFWDVSDIPEEFLTEAVFAEDKVSIKPHTDSSAENAKDLNDNLSECGGSSWWLLMVTLWLSSKAFLASTSACLYSMLMAVVTFCMAVCTQALDAFWQTLRLTVSQFSAATQHTMPAICSSLSLMSDFIKAAAIFCVAGGVVLCHFAIEWLITESMCALAALAACMIFVGEAAVMIGRFLLMCCCLSKAAVGYITLLILRYGPSTARCISAVSLQFIQISTALVTAAANTSISFTAQSSTKHEDVQMQVNCLTLIVWLFAGALMPMWIWDYIVQSFLSLLLFSGGMGLYMFCTAAAAVAFSLPIAHQQVRRFEQHRLSNEVAMVQ